MEKKGGKRALLATFIVVFVALCLLCKDRKPSGNENGNEQDEDVLENATLTLESVGDGSALIIRGNGSLDRHDMMLLFDEQGMVTSDIEILVIGGNINEIGYNCINHFKYLQTLIVEKNVARISNGAVRNCENLKWVYLSSSVQKIGADFLYGCNQTTVLTDGTADELPEMGNYSSNSVIENIKDYSTLFLYKDEEQEHPGFDFVFKCALLNNTSVDVEKIEIISDGLAGADESACAELVSWCDDNQIVALGSDEEFVDYCYNVVLGRDESDDERIAWVNSLKGGKTREDMVLSFLQCEEFRNKQGFPLE